MASEAPQVLIPPVAPSGSGSGAVEPTASPAAAAGPDTQPAPIAHASPVLAVHAFIAENEDELAFEIGERLVVVEKDEVYGDGWWRGRNAAGAEGLFPASYVQADAGGAGSKSAPADQSALKQDPAPSAGVVKATTPTSAHSASGTNNQAALSGLAAAAGITPTRELTEDDARVAPLVPAPAASPGVGTAAREEEKQQPTTPGGTVMQNTIGDIDKAISSLGPGQGGAAAAGAAGVNGSGKKALGGGGAGDEADDESLDPSARVDEDDVDADENDLGSPIWGAAGRSRLAEQARAENSRKEAEQAERDGLVRAIQAEEAPLSAQSNGNGNGTGAVKGLVYSDESEDEEDLQAQREVEAIRKRLADEEAQKQSAGTVESAAAVPPTTERTTAEQPKEENEGGIGGQALAAAAAVAVGTGAVVAAGYHSAAQAVGLESQEPPAAQASRDVSSAAQPRADEFKPPVRTPLPDESPRGTSQAPRFDSSEMRQPVALLPPPAISSVGPSPKSAAPPQFAVVSPSIDETTSANSPATSNGFSHTPLTGDSGVHPALEQPKTNGWASVPGEPSQWTVEQVVAWAKGKGFDEAVTSKFAEHEITGDVLLELDATMLKELEIPQLGKRIKIANAIAELRRPASLRSGGNGSVRSNSQQATRGNTSYATSEGGPSYLNSPVTPGQPSFPASPMQAQNLQSDSRPISAAAPVLDRSQSGQGAGSPTTPKDQAAQENVGLGYGQQDMSGSNGSNAAGSSAAGTGPAAGYAEWAHPHIRQQSQSGSLVNAPIKEEDESGSKAVAAPLVMSSIPNNRDSTGAMNSAGNSDSIRSKSSSVPASPSTTQTSVKRSSGPPTPLGHKKNKSSVDGGRTPSERMSFFGGAIGRNRKPAPRYPSNASTANIDRDDNSSGHERTRSIKGLISGPRAGRSSTATTDTTSRNRLSAASPERSAPASPIGAKTAGGSAVKQIGTPDFAGYMKKKGERYNSWKTRYFVLKGAHLYYMKDQNEAHIKGHIDLAGYKVMTDDETSGGSHGFQIVHEREKTHHFSSNDFRVIKDWMKNIMKATITRDYSAPVVSSCNIPTIPLREAQMMSPGPRPPSPSDIQATQRASRRENPNQLTARDASVLMSFEPTPTSPNPKSPRRSLALQQTTSRTSTLQPGRPSRDMRKPSEGAMSMPRHDSDASFYPPGQSTTSLGASPRKAAAPVALGAASPGGSDQQALLSWINAHIPPGCPRATHIPESFTNGQIITRCIEHIAGPALSPPPPSGDVIFAPTSSGPNIDGLFMMMDRCVDEGVDLAGVSMQDVMSGNEREIVKLLENLRRWGDAKASA